VFLTGGTGFLGAYILADLLSMPSVYQIGCLVRADNALAGLERLKAALVKYGL
jgi:thioester reductase-like protein